MKYLIRISPVQNNQSTITKYLIRLSGSQALTKAKELVKNGGIVRDNLSKSEAERIAGQLRNLGAVVEVSRVGSDEPETGYRLKLKSAGDSKIAVIKEVRLITGLGLKESKLLVDNLGVIGVFEDEKEAFSGKEKLEKAGAKAVVEKLHDTDPIPEPQPEYGSKDTNIIFGKITSGHKRPLQDLEIEIYDVDMRHWYPLANTLTDQDGKYSLEWTRDQLQGREYKTADIAVRVFTVERGSLLYETPIEDVRFNASQREEINITLKKPLPKEEIEFDLLVRKVRLLAGSVSIADLKEDDKHQDISFLVNELDVPSERIEYLVVAHRLESISDINAAFFYALLRTDVLLNQDFSKRLRARFNIGIESDDQTLLYDAALVDPETLESAIKTAVEDRVVAASEMENSIRNLKILSNFGKKASEYYKNHPKKVIDRFTNFFEENKLEEIQKLFNSNREDLDTFFEKVSDPSFFKSKEREVEAKTQIELGKFFGFSEEVIPKIARSKGINKSEDIRKLAKLNKSDWEAEIKKIDPNLKNKQLRSSYASAIVRKMEQEFPTLAFAAQLERSEKSVLKNQKTMVSFFNKFEDFDLQRHNVDLYFKEKKVSQKEKEAISEELKSVQRVFKLVPNYSKTVALREENINSSQNIVSLGQSRFKNELAPKAGISEPEANEIYRKAEARHTAAMLMAGDLQDNMSGLDIAAIGNSDMKKKLEVVSKDFPNLKSLFNITDTCECKHCRSVYSPAAYLVEILQFLEKRAVVSGSAENVLFKRRPDLGEIDLGCENAHTPVPYIDLVCEILEEAVSPDPGIEFHGDVYTETGEMERKITDEFRITLNEAGLSVKKNAQIFGAETAQEVNSSIVPPFYLRDEKLVCKITEEAEGQYKVYRLRQTLSTPEELDAAPEYVNEEAYKTLKHGNFAFSLPFDLHHTEARAYFDRFEVNRGHLMKLFQAGSNPSDEQIASENLGLTETECKLITVTPTPNNNAAQQRIWNVPEPGKVVEYLKQTNHFIERTGLTFKELKLLLKLKFINNSGNLFIRHNDTSCDTSTKEIANLNLNSLDRIHRFLRLQKKTGWSFEVLNEIISQPNLGAGQLDENCLIKAAQLKNISKKTKIKIEELIGFFGEIPYSVLDEDRPLPLYRQVFLNMAKTGRIERSLIPENLDNTDELSIYASYIANSLNLKESELDILIDLLPDGKLSISNLSYLYAASRLIKILDLDPRELSLLVELSELELSEPEDLQEFLKVNEIFKLSPLAVEDVKFLLNHNASNFDERIIQDSRIEEILKNFKEEFDEINKDLESPFDEDLSVEEQLETFASMLVGLGDIEEAEIKTFLRLIEGDWSDVSDSEGAKGFVESTMPDAIDKNNIHSAIEALDAVDPQIDNKDEQLDLLKVSMDAIAEYRISKSKQVLVAQILADNFKTDIELMGQLLKFTKLRQTPPGTEILYDLLTVDFDSPISLSEYPKQYSSIRLLQKLVLLLGAFDFTEAEVEWYFTNNENPSLGWLEFDTIPYETGQSAIAFAAYLKFIRIVSISNTLTAVENPLDTGKPVDFFTVAEIISQGNEADREHFFKIISLLTGHNDNTLRAIDTHLFNSFNISEYTDPDNWNRLLECAVFTRKLGATVEQVNRYIQPQLSISEVNDLRAGLKLKYDEGTWLSTLKEIMNVIRPKKRDALVAFLLATEHEMKDENHLYDYFLVDVEMESCMPSSRIVQAHHSIQLFVQRCLMGLEPEAIADLDRDPNWDQWKWMKSYRVWEANRKVFLYPENWYDVTLTGEKSYLLEELISEVQQNELTNDTAETALRNYLAKLDTISFLEVMATWYDVPTRTMHVFARTKGGDPAIYFYRKFEKERYWTPWEKVELDISGNHLLAFMRNNRLHLAWPVFQEVANEEQKIRVPAASDQGNFIDQEKPEKKIKIQLAISEHLNQKWQPKKVSNDGIITPQGWFTVDPKELKERCALKYISLPEEIPTGNKFSFPDQIWLVNRSGKGEVMGVFNLAGCKGYPEVFRPESIAPNKSPINYLIANYLIPQFKKSKILPQVWNTQFIKQKFVESNEGSGLFVKNVPSILNSDSQFHNLLQKTPETFRVTHPHQVTILDLISVLMLGVMNSSENNRSTRVARNLNISFGTLLPYFKEDNEHAYVIVPGFFKKGDKGREESISDVEKRTVSNVFQLFDDILIWYKKIQGELEEKPTESYQETIEYIIDDSDFQKLLRELSTYANLDVFTNLLIGVSDDPKVEDLLHGIIKEQPLVYGEQFKNMYHPMVCALRSKLYKGGIPELMKRETQLLETDFDFSSHYLPNNKIVPQERIRKADGNLEYSYPVEDIDFESDGSYSAYNWDLFYRVPLHIATTLTKQQRFEEAMEWFHYMFNPTGALPGNGVQKYWVTKPFYLHQEENYINQRIDSIMYNTADMSNSATKELEFAVSEWRSKPFRPDVIARNRPVAYQKALLMKYIDNLTEWGDYLFRQDTMESIAQATQMYVLADKLLGPKPRIVSPPIKQPYETYNQLREKIGSFGNALIELENIIPNISALPEGGNELPAPPVTLSLLYFCVPSNEKMSEYWDRIADRLFKIRHCQNIDGVERNLALFAPPIDPDMLVRAAASGLDLSQIIQGFNTSLPHYRFNVMSQKATELINEVRTLGNALLQAMEKKDGEDLALLRSDLELNVLNAVTGSKKLQVDEAEEQIQILNRTKKVTKERYEYYKAIEKVSEYEQASYDKQKLSKDYKTSAQGVKLAASIISLLPEIDIGASGFGGSPVAKVKSGGLSFGQATNAASDILSFLSVIASNEASSLTTKAGWERRYDDWKLQERVAEKEIESIEKQIEAAEIRKEIVEKDLNTHELQIENAKKTDEFMRSKFTNQELYDWMIGEISSVYFKSYQLAHDIAKKAERCYRVELGNDDTFIHYGYWDSMKKGLQTADRLIHDIKRMETSYMDKNRREYELTKHISLAQLDPSALIRLRNTGICDFEIPEVLYDIDHPGQYFRRIKTVSISVPCVAGPHTSVSAKLSLVNNKYRKNINNLDNYPEEIGNDNRFNYNIGAIQSIATSNAQNDSGVFELSFKDERYLPFENNGAISNWRLELPTEVRQFDYNTISDVILHLKYTAREGGSLLKEAANNSIKEQIQSIHQSLNQKGLHVGLNLKNDKPNQWHLLKQEGVVNLLLDKSKLPYMVQGFDSIEVDKVTFLAEINENATSFKLSLNDNIEIDFVHNEELGLYKGTNSDIQFDTPFQLGVNTPELDELRNLFVMIKYKF